MIQIIEKFRGINLTNDLFKVGKTARKGGFEPGKTARKGGFEPGKTAQLA